MRYRTMLDDIIIDFKGDDTPATLTLKDINNPDPLDMGVTIRADQYGCIKVVRRALNDLFEAEREKQKKHEQSQD